MTSYPDPPFPLPKARGEENPQHRPFVRAMADAMEAKLLENDFKNLAGWEGLDDVFAKLQEEVAELMREAVTYGNGARLLAEAADVANVAGMVVVYLGNQLPHYGTT